MNTFNINGNTYIAKPFDFNLLCDLEDMGVSMNTMATKTMSTARTYFALCCGGDKEFAGNELQAHMINGGSFEGLISAMAKEMEESDFFQAMTNGQKSETLTVQKRTYNKKN